MRLLVTVLALVAVGHCKLFPCDNADIYSPCDCEVSNVTKLQYLTCDNIHEESVFDDIFRRDLPNRRFEGLYVLNSDLPTLSNVFNGTQFTNIAFNELGRLGNISADTFADSKDTLSFIEFRFTPHLSPKDVPFAEFASFSKRVSITLQGLKNGDGLPLIKTADFNQVIIFDFDIGKPIPEGFMKDATASLVKLEQLQARSLPKDSFSIRAPMNLSLASNAIAAIDEGAFVVDHQQGLTGHGVNINMCNNQLHTIDEKVWGKVFPMLASFFVCENPLTCGCDLAWIYRDASYRTMFVGSLVFAPYQTFCQNGRNLAQLTARDFQHCP